MNFIIKSGITAGALAVAALFVGASGAAAATAGDLAGQFCGNKGYKTSQDTGLTAPDPTFDDLFNNQVLCDTGNSTGGMMNSPIIQLGEGWKGGSEVQGSGAGGDDDGTLDLSFGNNSWSIDLLGGTFARLGLSIKQGNGYIFYELDQSLPLSGDYYTFDANDVNFETPKSDFSHANAWYVACLEDGSNCDDPEIDFDVPVPAGLPLVLTGLGVMGVLRNKKRKKA